MEHRAIAITAPAKINLSLDVIRRLDNGYHELKSVMQSLLLSDIVTLRRTPGFSTKLQLNVTSLPTDENNIALKAWRLLQQKFSLPDEVAITIEKNIPIAAGLAGGSTDAAAVISGINQLFNLELSPEEMENLGASLGSDVPFCLRQGLALASGTGTQLTSLPSLEPLHVLLINPGFAVSTRLVYQHLTFANGQIHPDVLSQVEAIRKHDNDAVLRLCGNYLEHSAFNLFPALSAIKEDVAATGLTALLCGSGGTVFGLSRKRVQAETAFEALKKRYPIVLLTETAF